MVSAETCDTPADNIITDTIRTLRSDKRNSSKFPSIAPTVQRNTYGSRAPGVATLLMTIRYGSNTTTHCDASL